MEFNFGNSLRKFVENILQRHGLIGAREYASKPDPYPMMYLGRVLTEIDPLQSGNMSVIMPHLGSPTDVNYSTPYHGKGGSGFFSVPEKDSIVLVAHVPDGDPRANPKRKYIYISTLVAPDVPLQAPGENILGPLQTGGVLPDPDIYKARARPMKYVWKSPHGHAFTMSDLYEPSFFNTRIEMKSGLGKKVVCDDSPLKDCILIQNEHGDHIKLTTNFVLPAQPARALDIDTKGPHLYQTRESQMDLRVVDGWNLDIVNTSTGYNAAEGSADWGKVNVLAQNNDMTLTCNEGKGTSMEDVPSMFITTNGQESIIQIDSRGAMKIIVRKDIEVIAEEGNIGIHAQTGDINMSSGGDVNINSGGVINLNTGGAQSGNAFGD